MRIGSTSRSRRAVGMIGLLAAAVVTAASATGAAGALTAQASGCGQTDYLVAASRATGDAFFCGIGTHNTEHDGPFYSLGDRGSNRIWLHQHPNGKGWADCFQHSGGEHTFTLTGRDTTPGNIQVSANTSPCP
jgi:hypothetical protein